MSYLLYLKRKKKKLHFKNIVEIKKFLKRKAFLDQKNKTWLFEDNTFLVLKANFDTYERSKITGAGIKPRHNYLLFQYESSFIFRTYKNELHPKENEFIISIKNNSNTTCTITFTPIGYKMEELKLVSQ
jgi:hypothetical protein